MQQPPVIEEERYSDGFEEYLSFYGGPSYNYHTPGKSAPSTFQNLPPSHPSATNPHRQSAATSLKHAISYDLAANIPEFRKEAEGLQVVHQPPSARAPARRYPARQDSLKDVEAHLPQGQPPPPCFTLQYDQDRTVDPRFHNAQRFSIPTAVPAPLTFARRLPQMETDLQRFPQPPTSPTSSSPQENVHPAFRMSNSPQQSLAVPVAPQPLKFLRSETLPPSPPHSVGGRSNDDALRDRMGTLNMGDPPPIIGRYALGTLKYPPGMLTRMNTMSSVSSGLSSGAPGSPFQHHERISIVQADSTLPGILEHGPPEMTLTEAHAEVLRLLDKADETSSRKSAAPKKGFLRRSNTTKPASSNASHSQDTLTNVLEDLAEEGSIPMVKAVIALGADPVYRSSGKMKKVKHEALEKATANGHAKVVDFLLRKGASYGEPQKKAAYTPLDRALLGAVYKGHAELASILISAHDANPMVEQWPREMDDAQHYWAQNQVRLSKTSVLDGLSHWKNEEEGMSVLRHILDNPKFDPAAPVSGVFDNKSELQTAEFGHRPWYTTYEYSALACFARAGWADAVEEMLNKKGSPSDYEREDEVLQYQDKVTRWISPVNALTKDTWEHKPEGALRILRLLIDRGFNTGLYQRTANDLGQRTPLGRALAANASQGVELIAQSRPELVKEVISFRRNKRETKAQPLAAALALEKLDTARVLLRAGAHPRDPAFGMNVLQFAAHQGGETGTAMLAEMIGLAPELTYAALDIAIRRIHKDCVRVVLDSISAAASRNEIAALPAIWDMLLPLPDTELDIDTKTKYLDLIDMVHTWDAGGALPRPQLPAILAAIKRDNYVGMERMLKVGVVDGSSLVLNCKAQPLGDNGMWTVLECSEETSRSAEWLGLLRGYGAPLYT